MARNRNFSNVQEQRILFLRQQVADLDRWGILEGTMSTRTFDNDDNDSVNIGLTMHMNDAFNSGLTVQ